jgi:hypothetical protein
MGPFLAVLYPVVEVSACRLEDLLYAVCYVGVHCSAALEWKDVTLRFSRGLSSCCLQCIPVRWLAPWVCAVHLAPKLVSNNLSVAAVSKGCGSAGMPFYLSSHTCLVTNGAEKLARLWVKRGEWGECGALWSHNWQVAVHSPRVADSGTSMATPFFCFT